MANQPILGLGVALRSWDHMKLSLAEATADRFTIARVAHSTCVCVCPDLRMEIPHHTDREMDGLGGIIVGPSEGRCAHRQQSLAPKIRPRALPSDVSHIWMHSPTASEVRVRFITSRYFMSTDYSTHLITITFAFPLSLLYLRTTTTRADSTV